MSRGFRSIVSQFFHDIANAIYNEDHLQEVEVVDEYGICRCLVKIRVDEHAHGVEKTFERFPVGWEVHEYMDGTQRR